MANVAAVHSNTIATPTSGKGIRVGLWSAQVLLALAFVASGLMKITTPIEQLQAQMPWTTGAMGSLVRFIGVAELLGGIGVVLPAATRIKPQLAVLAALGLATVMVLASITHLTRGEAGMVPVNVVLFAVAAFVAWGRSKRAPISPRS
jgi:uncharacterized membrane protein YphA (DoxX/SURF4 family)